MNDHALRWVTRVGAFPRKEMVEIVRQPILILALVFGPFLILLLFGATLRDAAPVVPAIFVVPEGGALAGRVTELADSARLRIVEVTSDEDAALQRLREEDVGLVVVFPPGAAEAVRRKALDVFTLRLVDEANQQLLARLIADVQARAAPVGEDLQTSLTRVQALRLALEEAQRQLALSGAPQVRLADFYAPAAVALLLQHLVVTFVGLSIVRGAARDDRALPPRAPLAGPVADRAVPGLPRDRRCDRRGRADALGARPRCADARELGPGRRGDRGAAVLLDRGGVRDRAGGVQRQGAALFVLGFVLLRHRMRHA